MQHCTFPPLEPRSHKTQQQAHGFNMLKHTSAKIHQVRGPGFHSPERTCMAHFTQLSPHMA